jgi:hypothetical protein
MFSRVFSTILDMLSVTVLDLSQWLRPVFRAGLASSPAL